LGAKRARQAAFLAKHPTCCFCGGSTPATTRDHLPPRSVFVEKKWPEGYEFPACLTCNNGSAGDDALIAFLSRMNPGRDHTPTEEKEWAKLLASLQEHYPGVTRGMLLGANEVRRWMTDRKVPKPPGKAYGEMPIIKIPKLLVTAVERFNAKLLRALHYKHTGRIVPSGAWTRTRWWTNANLAAGEFPQDIANLIPGVAVLQRGKVSLQKQFSYKFGVGDNGQMGAYLAALGGAFATVGLVVFDRALVAGIDEKSVQDAIDRSVVPTVSAVS
jgi:hypothetical protein